MYFFIVLPSILNKGIKYKINTYVVNQILDSPFVDLLCSRFLAHPLIGVLATSGIPRFQMRTVYQAMNNSN
jgi:hypothetical protein